MLHVASRLIVSLLMLSAVAAAPARTEPAGPTNPSAAQQATPALTAPPALAVRPQAQPGVPPAPPAPGAPAIAQAAPPPAGPAAAAPLGPVPLAAAPPAATVPQAAPAATVQPPPAAPAPAPTPAAGGPAPAAEPAPPQASPLAPEINDSVRGLVVTMENAEKALGRMKDLGDDIGRLRNEVEHVIAKTTEVADGLRPRRDEVKRQIEKLGPAPGKDAPPEDAGIAGERARLNAEATALDGAIKTLELTWVRARQTIDKITDLRLAIFTKSLMERMASPLLPGMWSDAIRDIPQTARLIGYIGSDWLSSLRRHPVAVPLLLGAAVGLYLFAKLLVRRLTRHRRPGNVEAPSFFARTATASWMAPVRALPAIVTGLLVYSGLDALGLLYYPSVSIAGAVLRSVVIFAAVAALIRTALAPAEARQRLVSLSDRSARRLSRFLTAMAAVYAADLAMTSIGRALYLPLSMSVLQSLVTAVTLSALLIGLLLTPFEAYGAPVGATPPRDRPRWIKLPLGLAALAIIVACALGYVALGRFAAQQLVMTGVVGLVLFLLHTAIRSLTQQAESATALGGILESRFGIDAPRRHQLARLGEAALTVALGLLALPVLLLQWGFSGAEIKDWVQAAIFGFEIGHFRISLARILLGIVLFTVLLFLTRVVQRWLRETVLAPPRMEQGLANSIDTMVGYAGTIVAALVAISYAGIDITNLAILAGALSVGIGFGLQSIVNNFVSGLILLFERPVKVGDWIVVKDNEGYVRRISVRSTEIETFDRASVIVPNSELITGVVKNWTHRNSLGRVVVKVRTTYKVDPEAVRQTLLRVAEHSPHILQHPEPSAVLDNLGDQALEFSLRAHVADITKAADVQTELREQILDAFRAAGIPIPFGGADASSRPAAAGGRTRVRVRVRAPYRADPDHVITVLQGAASGIPGLVATPPPQVRFDELGDRGLELSVVGLAEAGSDAGTVESELRRAILRAMAGAGIEIPYAQHDVHLRDLDTVRALITRVADERARARQEAAQDASAAAGTPPAKDA